MAEQKVEDKPMLARIGTFTAVAACSGKCLTNNGFIVQQEWTDSNKQHWYLEHYGRSKYYVIRNKDSGRVLTITSTTNVEHQRVDHFKFDGGDNQLWLLKSNSEGCVSFHSACDTSFVITVSGQSPFNSTFPGIKANDVYLETTKYTGADSQLFLITDTKLTTGKSTVLVTAGTLMVLGVGEEKNDGVVQSKWVNKKNQKWNVVRQDEFKYSIESEVNGKVLTASNSNIIMAEFIKDQQNQLWEFSQPCAGGWVVQNASNGLVLSVKDSSKNAGAAIILSENKVQENQIFAVKDSGAMSIVVVTEENEKEVINQLSEYIKEHKDKVSVQYAKEGNMSILWASASAGRDEGFVMIMSAMSAKAELALVEFATESTGIETVEFKVLNLKLEVWYGYGVGIDLSAHLIEAKASAFDFKLGIGISTGFGIKDDSLSIEALGCGFTIGRKIAISVFDSEIGVDLARCQIL